MKRRVFAVVCGVVATLLTAPPPGAADGAVDAGPDPSRLVLTDGAGDVWKQDMVTGDLGAVGGHPTIDVTRTVARHRHRDIIIRLRFVDLRPHGIQTQAAFIRTPKRLYLARVQSDGAHRHGRHQLQDWSPPSDGNLTLCAGFTHRIDYVRDVVVMRIPRSCLGKPQWVQLKIDDNMLPPGIGPIYSDNPHNHRAEPSRFTRRLPRG